MGTSGVMEGNGTDGDWDGARTDSREERASLPGPQQGQGRWRDVIGSQCKAVSTVYHMQCTVIMNSSPEDSASLIQQKYSLSTYYKVVNKIDTNS